MTSQIGRSLRARPSVGLDEIQAVADLQTRFDRKYLVPIADVQQLIDAADQDVAVLRIGDRQEFTYQSLYFDTPELDAYLLTARQRPNRFKVRLRTYVDSDLCMLEVKRRNGRSATVKHRVEHPLGECRRLTSSAIDFVDAATDSPTAARLLPVITTNFRRVTFLDQGDGSRATIDRDLSWCAVDGSQIDLADSAVVETKTQGAASDLDRWLWRHGHRPMPISKYCVGMALHDPTLPAHRWNRLLRATFGWKPDWTP